MASHSVKKPDLVICDWDFSQAPPATAPSQIFRELDRDSEDDGLGTIGLIEKMQKRLPKLLFIISTGGSNYTIPNSIKSLASVEIFAKPYIVDQLMEKVTGVLDVSRKR